MCIRDRDSIVGKCLECKSKDGNSDREVTDYIPIPELQSFSYDMIICKIKSLGKDYMACFDSKEMSLTISPNYTDRDYVILHEMIHIHEFLLSKILSLIHIYGSREKYLILEPL